MFYKHYDNLTWNTGIMKFNEYSHATLLYTENCSDLQKQMLGIKAFETREKIRLREIALRWELERGCEEKITTEFWTKKKRNIRILKRWVFSIKIALWALWTKASTC